MTTRQDATTKLAIRVILSQDGEKKTYAQRIFTHISPALSDEEILSIGRKLGALQAHEVEIVSRTDVAGLEAVA